LILIKEYLTKRAKKKRIGSGWGGEGRVTGSLAITYLLVLKFVFKVNTQLFQESYKTNGSFVAPGEIKQSASDARPSECKTIQAWSVQALLCLNTVSFSVQTPAYKKMYPLLSACKEFNFMLMRLTYFCGFRTVSALQL